MSGRTKLYITTNSPYVSDNYNTLEGNTFMRYAASRQS